MEPCGGTPPNAIHPGDEPFQSIHSIPSHPISFQTWMEQSNPSCATIGPSFIVVDTYLLTVVVFVVVFVDSCQLVLSSRLSLPLYWRPFVCCPFCGVCCCCCCRRSTGFSSPPSWPCVFSSCCCSWLSLLSLLWGSMVWAAAHCVAAMQFVENTTTDVWSLHS